MLFDRCFVLLCLLYAVSANGIALRKCCPKGQSLSMNDLNERQIVCVPSEDDSESESFPSYNLEISDEPFKPSCLNWHSHRHGNPVDIINLSGCVDIVRGYLQSIQCVPSALPNIEVVRYQKCCIEGHSYDLDQRQCVYTPNEFSAFRNFLGNNTAVIFKTQVPKCQPDEVFVEYHSYHHTIWPTDGTIAVTHPHREDEILAAGSFCIDSSWRSENAEQLSAEETYNIIVRSCRPNSVCDHIPCVRRCCANDQMLERRPGDTKSQCYDHPELRNFAPAFHNVLNPMVTHEPELVNQTGKLICWCSICFVRASIPFE